MPQKRSDHVSANLKCEPKQELDLNFLVSMAKIAKFRASRFTQDLFAKQTSSCSAFGS